MANNNIPQFSTYDEIRVALYARVSTTRDQDPEMQLRELCQYAARRGWTIVSEYVDHGVSGSEDTRPQLNKLMAAAHRREFDAILCWKIDRFGRSLKHLVNALAELDAYGVAFVSLRDNLDLSTPQGRLMFGIIGCMAQFERELIRERVRSGIANAQAKGVRVGRPSVAVDALAVSRLRSKAGRGLRYAASSISAREAPRGLLSAFPPPRQIRRCAHDQMVVVRTVSINPHRGCRVPHLGGVPHRQGARWHPGPAERNQRPAAPSLGLRRGLNH